MKDENEIRLDYLISLQEDLRGEIKQRISQRDGFATQFLVACGTVITISFLDFSYAAFLIWLMPLATIFYSLQILYSYVMHENLTDFLMNHIEPAMSELIGIELTQRSNWFWELRCSLDRDSAKTKYPGIRKNFFQLILFVMPAVTLCIFIV